MFPIVNSSSQSFIFIPTKCTKYRAFHNFLHHYTFVTRKPKTYHTGIIHSYRKTYKFFFDNYRYSVFAPPVTRHTSIQYSRSCHTHASTWVHRYSSLLQWSVPLRQRGHMAMLGRILCTKRTLHSNHRLTVWYSDTQNYFSPEAAIF